MQKHMLYFIMITALKYKEKSQEKFTKQLIINYELIKNNLPPVVITKEDRVKYFEFLRNKDVEDFAKWLEELSDKEKERINNFII